MDTTITTTLPTTTVPTAVTPKAVGTTPLLSTAVLPSTTSDLTIPAQIPSYTPSSEIPDGTLLSAFFPVYLPAVSVMLVTYTASVTEWQEHDN